MAIKNNLIISNSFHLLYKLWLKTKTRSIRIREENNLEDKIKRSHEDCEKMDDDQLLALDSVNR